MFKFGHGAGKAFREAIGGLLGIERFKADTAEGIAGMVDKHGRDKVADEYAKRAEIKPKSARDAIRKFIRGDRKPSAKTVDQLKKVEAKAAKDHKAAKVAEIKGQAGGLSVSVEGTFRTSRTSWSGVVSAHLIGSAQEQFTNAMAAGDMRKALDIVLKEYGPHFAENIEEVEEIGSVTID